MPGRPFDGPAADDPSLIGSLPPSWPHDAVECESCWALGVWRERWSTGPEGNRRTETNLNRYAERYPLIYAALTDHARLVSAARRDGPTARLAVMSETIYVATFQMHGVPDAASGDDHPVEDVARWLWGTEGEYVELTSDDDAAKLDAALDSLGVAFERERVDGVWRYTATAASEDGAAPAP